MYRLRLYSVIRERTTLEYIVTAAVYDDAAPTVGLILISSPAKTLSDEDQDLAVTYIKKQFSGWKTTMENKENLHAALQAKLDAPALPK